MDNVEASVRSRTMSAIRGMSTQPELKVRRGLHRRGFRFRLHCTDLPGRPDLTLPKWGAVVFVNGCFWHGHGCARFRLPSSRIDYWGPKILRNRQRDKRNAARLRRLGWRVLRVWECELRKDAELAIARLAVQLRARPPNS
jgi:DNA mismatch endonuclease (patch repair protein)